MPWYSGSFQRKLGILVANDSLFTRIQQYVSMIQLPNWFHKENAGIEEVRRLMDWALEMALTVYVCAEKRNDFFLLHGVTSAWALTKVSICRKYIFFYQNMHNYVLMRKSLNYQPTDFYLYLERRILVIYRSFNSVIFYE